MAKPDWGELQQRFLSEHAATGVSPKEWCEAQGLNYATARRYIKKTSAQKPAQKKMRTAQKDKSANELVDDDGLTAQQRRFVAEYLKDGNATQAAIRAGYSKKSAEQIGYQLLQKTSVAQAIAQQQKASIARTLGGADEVLAQMWQLEKLRKELAGDGDDDEPTPVQININVVDARAEDGDQPDT